MQHFGAQRLALHLPLREMLEQRRHGARSLRPVDEAEVGLAAADREPLAAGQHVALAVQQTSLAVLDGHRRTEGLHDRCHERVRFGLPPDDAPEPGL